MRPTATPLPTLSAEEISVDVVAWERRPISPLNRHFRYLLESQNRRPKFMVNDDLVTLDFRGHCGDECSYQTTLKLRHTADGSLPEFVYYTHDTSDYYGGQTQFQMAEGTVEIDQWDLNGVISGRVASPEGKYRVPELVFWYDFAQSTMAGKHVAGRVVLSNELEEALRSGSLDDKLLAMLIIEQNRHRETDKMLALVPDLLDLLPDLTSLDGTGEDDFMFLGNRATFTLSELLSTQDATYFANREPILAYTFYELDKVSAETPLPSPERIAELQTNWQAFFDSFE